MSHLESQYALQGGRCWICGIFTLPCRLTFDHIVPRNGRTSRKRGRDGCMLAHKACNEARRNKAVGSNKFNRWIWHVLNEGRLDWQRSNQRPRFNGLGLA